MLRSILILTAVEVAIGSLAFKSSGTTGTSTYKSWNELVNADGIFGDRLNTIHYKSGGDTSNLLTEFKNLLSEEKNLQDVYKNYKTLFGKVTEATKSRLDTFKEKMVQIAAHNLDASAGKHSWFMGVTQFTDLTSRDPEMMQKPFANDTLLNDLNSMPYKSSQKIASPAYLNYVSQNIVSSVKNQGKCGSCSMFASAAALESAVARKYKTAPVDLSVQELMDCAVRGFNCTEGTSPADSFNYYQRNGATTCAAYPYTGRVGECQTSLKPIVAHVWSSKVYNYQNEASLIGLLADKGPLVVYFYASAQMGNYKSGVFTGPDCGTNASNHAVELVGYGTDSISSQPYWLIKNSWGTSWGENGYLRLLRGINRLCDLGALVFSVIAA